VPTAGVRFLGLLTLLAVPVAASALPPQGKTAGTSKKQAAGKHVHGIKPERVQACEDTFDRLIQEVAKGSDASFAHSDLEFADLCRIALSVSDINIVASSPLPEHRKHIKLELFQKAEETSARILAEFNEKGSEAYFSSSDLALFDTFRKALLAMDTLGKAASPRHRRKVKPELVTSAREAAKRMLAEFNERGYEAQFANADIATVREFHNALGNDE